MATDNVGTQLVTASELAKILNVHVTTIYRMRDDGRIKGYKIKREHRYNIGEVLEAMKS